jgi:hypothetical protein
VVVLTNSVDHPLQGKLSIRLLGELSGTSTTRATETPATPPAGLTVSADQLGALAGEYVGRGGDIATLLVRDSQLIFRNSDTDQSVRMTAATEFRLDSDASQRFRVLPCQDGRPGYLQNAYDGSTRYRNDVPDQSPLDQDHGDQEFVVTRSGTTVGSALLRQLPGGDGLLRMPNQPTLRLAEIGQDLYISAMGEVLNLARHPPSYGSIRLHRPSRLQAS